MKKILWGTLTQAEKKNLLKRSAQTAQNLDFKQRVKNIVDTVQMQGDTAILSYTQQFDQVTLKQLKVSEQEFLQASREISPKVRRAIEFSIENIKTYHAAQRPVPIAIETRKGVLCQQQARPIQSVGLYVPGGSAPLLSTAMMLAVPASLAGCQQIILCSPPDKKGNIHPALLMACQLSGVSDIYKIGGAQAIAAMAYGTQTVPKTDKIFGPGNAIVTQAKLQVSEDPEGAAIDLPAGPSELMIIADETANPEFIAADLLSQAEHGTDSQVFLVTPVEALINQVQTALDKQIRLLSRKNIMEISLKTGAMILVKDFAQAVEVSNQYAPEHLIVASDHAEQWVASIHCAGAVFLGHLTPETAGDYVTGSNHVLPTYGYARNHSGLSLRDFMKFISIQSLSREGLKTIAEAAEILSELEGLTAHKNAITLRLREEAL